MVFGTEAKAPDGCGQSHCRIEWAANDTSRFRTPTPFSQREWFRSRHLNWGAHLRKPTADYCSRMDPRNNNNSNNRDSLISNDSTKIDKVLFSAGPATSCPACPRFFACSYIKPYVIHESRAHLKLTSSPFADTQSRGLLVSPWHMADSAICRLPS